MGGVSLTVDSHYVSKKTADNLRRCNERLLSPSIIYCKTTVYEHPNRFLKNNKKNHSTKCSTNLVINKLTIMYNSQ